MRTIIFLALISIFISSCGSGSSPKTEKYDEGPVVAVINADTIHSEFFEKAYIENLIQTGANDTRAYRYQFLQKLTDEVLLSQQAGAYGLNDAAFREYQEQVKRLSVADRFYSSTFLDTLSEPSEEQIQAAFFNTKVKMHVSHLFFTDKQEADKAYQRLEEGEQFLDLANEIYHLTDYDSTAGYIGEVSYFNVDDAFGEAAYQLRAGEYSKPVRSRQGYHIIYVDERIGNPLVTQAEFEYKKRGITGLTKNRIKTLKGDAFVQTYMQSLDVKVDEAAVEQLYFALRNLSPQNRTNPMSPGQEIASYPSTSDVNYVQQALEPGTILASYNHQGEERYFTAGDYAKWLKTIPLEEVRGRTMASVGRALRNQVFYEAGMEEGIQHDPIVEYNVAYKTTFYKAYRVKKYLDSQPVPDISEEEQKAAFYGLGMNTVKVQQVSGWTIETEDFRQAQRIQQAIKSGESPAKFEGYRELGQEDLRQGNTLLSHIFNAPLETPVVAGTEQAFYVLYVQDRNREETTFEEARDKVLTEMKRHYNIVHELKTLRQKAKVEVDTTAFENMMTHFDDPALRGQSVEQ